MARKKRWSRKKTKARDLINGRMDVGTQLEILLAREEENVRGLPARARRIERDALARFPDVKDAAVLRTIRLWARRLAKNEIELEALRLTVQYDGYSWEGLDAAYGRHIAAGKAGRNERSVGDDARWLTNYEAARDTKGR